jgi:ArsR family metal-binding transcriptional regulator
MRLMMQIDELHAQLPRIDCGSCGAPTCRAFAEDVVKGEAKLEDCVVLLRRRLHEQEGGAQK